MSIVKKVCSVSMLATMVLMTTAASSPPTTNEVSKSFKSSISVTAKDILVDKKAAEPQTQNSVVVEASDVNMTEWFSSATVTAIAPPPPPPMIAVITKIVEPEPEPVVAPPTSQRSNSASRSSSRDSLSSSSNTSTNNRSNDISNNNNSESSNANQLPSIPTGEVQEIARQKVLERGWSESDFTCLVSLWKKESNWNYQAANPTSSARGIPQAMMGAHFGRDWQSGSNTKAQEYLNNPGVQIDWGLNYISGRYSTPCSAWSHSQAKNWY